MKIHLNLIPPYKREEINQACRFLYVLKWGIELLAVLAVFSVMLFSISYIVKINLKIASDDLAQGEKGEKHKEIADYEKEFKIMNAKTAEVLKIQKNQLHWSKLFSMLDNFSSENITLSGLSTKNYAVSLSGKAINRDDLISLRDKLETEKCFTEVNLPLSSLVSRENVDFQISFKVNKECLK